ncbi:DUF554 domain-containing protein [Treponema sp. OttesenSCG-928-L16]|nr:DUF554 domain-containing protein [Treponema sp. OttesenSCG-928-L16]
MVPDSRGSGNSGFLFPFTTQTMIADFTAYGGLMMIATGLRIGQIKSVSTVNLLPAFILVMLLSYLFDRFF